MSDSTEGFVMFDEDSPRNKKKGGIKNYTFTPTGTNGTAHRAGAARRKIRQEKNRQIRAGLYSEMQGERGSPKEWHMRIEALSKGTS